MRFYKLGEFFCLNFPLTYRNHKGAVALFSLSVGMGDVRSFFIESKFFQLILEEGGLYYRLQIFERGKFFMRSVFMGKNVA